METLRIDGSLNDFFFVRVEGRGGTFSMVDNFVVSWIINELGVSVRLCNNFGVEMSVVLVKLVDDFLINRQF